MRKPTLFPILLAVLGFAAGAAQAQSEEEKILDAASTQGEGRPAQHPRDDALDDEELDAQVFYSGFGLARVQTDYLNLGEAVNLEGVMGFRVPTLPWFALELDIAQTIIPGENQPLAPGTPTSNCGPADELLGLCSTGGSKPATRDPDDFGMQALGVALALKSSGRFYVTGRYGYRYVFTSISELNERRSGEGFGAGVGYRWGRGHSGVELAYEQLAEELDSIGLVFFVRMPRR